MKTIEDLAVEAAIDSSNLISRVPTPLLTEFLRRVFALRDAEAVPVAVVSLEAPCGISFTKTGAMLEVGSKLYPHAPAPSDLQAENERLKAERAVMQKRAVDTFDSGEQLRQQLAESQAENEMLKSEFEFQRCEHAQWKVAHAEKCEKINAMWQQLAESQAREKKLRDALIHHQKLTRPIEQSMEALAATSDDTALRAYVEKEVAQRTEVMRHDFGPLQQFHSKHALGPMLPPSCLVCGTQTLPRELDMPASVAIQHMELPAIVVCKRCKELAALKQQEPVAITTRAQINAMQNGANHSILARAPRFAAIVASDNDVNLYTAPATDYKDVAERLLRGAERTVEQVKQRGTALDITPRSIELLLSGIAAAKAAGLGEK